MCGAGCTWSESRDTDTPQSAAVTPGPVCHAERPLLSPGDDGMPSSSTSAYSSTAGSTSAEVDRDIVSTTDRDSARHRNVDREELSTRVAVVRPLTPCADDEQTDVKTVWTNDDDSDDEETGLKSVVTAGFSTHHTDSGNSRRHSDDVSVNGVSLRPIDGAIGVTTDSSDARRVTIGISDMSLLILVTLGVSLMTVVTLGVSLLTSVTVCMLLVTVVTVTLGMSLNR